MTEYPELYNEITKKLKELKIKETELKKTKDQSESDYNDIKEKIEILEREKSQLIEQKNNSIGTKIFNLKLSIFIITMLIMLLSMFGYLALSMKLAYFTLPIADFSLKSLAAFGILVPGELACVFIIPALFKVIERKASKRLRNKIINSEEYQNLKKQLTHIQEQLELARKEEREKTEVMNNATEQYNLCMTDIRMKEALINYLKNERNNPSETTTETKPYARRRTQNHQII